MSLISQEIQALSGSTLTKTFCYVASELQCFMNTCIEQLLVDLVIFRQVDVVVLLPAVGQVAVNGIVSGLEDPVLVVFQRLQRNLHYNWCAYKY